jgi:hypothetical protein
VRIRLARELAERLESDPSVHGARDVVELPRYAAELLIAEGWAVTAEEPPPFALQKPPRPQLMVTTTLLKLRTVEQLRRMREVQAVKQHQEQTRRRAEDRIRDELRDARAKTIAGSATDNRRNRPRSDETG